MIITKQKPLGRKAYGSIPHLPGSRMGPKDHGIHPGQARICTEKKRDEHDKVIVQEKYDGSCVAVAKIGGELLPLTRRGYLAESSPYECHHLWAKWVKDNLERFDRTLEDGEWLVGEWLAMAHGTKYVIPEQWDPFVAFDLFRGGERVTHEELTGRFLLVSSGGKCRPFMKPRLMGGSLVGSPMSFSEGLMYLDAYDCFDQREGLIYRVERKERVDFLAKYVRPGKVDGLYLPEISGKDPVWNWHPDVTPPRPCVPSGWGKGYHV